MRRKILIGLGAVGTATLGLLLLLSLMAVTGPGVSAAAVAGPGQNGTPSVAGVEPDAAPNDIGMAIVVTGSDFSAVMSGTAVVTAPTVTLGDAALDDVVWVSSSTVSATVPWGLDPGVYTLTVTNPDGSAGDLPSGFTVTQGIGVWTTGGPYGGRVNFVTLRPDGSAGVYAGTQWAGLFASEDGARSWEAILPGSFSTRLTFDAGSADVMYYSGDSAQFYRTEDGGETWELLPQLFWSENGCYTVYAAAHPANAGEIYAGTGGCGDIPLLPGEGGVYHSTDYGATWDARNEGLTDTDVVDIAFHPTDPMTMVVATRSGNVFSTTDGGLNWGLASTIDHELRRLTINPHGGHESWAVPEVPPNPAAPAKLYRSFDLTTWELITLTNRAAPFGGVWSVTFAPGKIWAAGDWGYVSEDGGTTWSAVMDESWELGGLRSFAIDPSDGNTMYAADSNWGVLKSEDGGATWTEVNEGLAALTTRDLAATPGHPDLVYVETFELGLLRSGNGGYSWQELGVRKFGPPKGKLIAVDPFQPGRLYYPNSCSGDGPCVWYSSDAGSTWNEVSMPVPVTYTGQLGELTTIAAHPLVSGTVFASAGFFEEQAEFDAGTEPCGLYRSVNYGESWEFLGPTPSLSEVHELAFDAVDPDLIYATVGERGLWRTEDGGENWVQVPISTTESPVSVPAIAPHPDVSGKVYVRTYSGTDPNPEPELWVSEDRGDSWQALTYVFLGVDLLVSPPLPDQATYSLYTGCELGLCRSADDGEVWQLVEGSPRPEFLDASSDGERSVVYLGTFGGLVSAVEGQGIGAQETGIDQENVVGAGIYRLTRRLQSRRVYLPVGLRGYGR